MIATPSPTPRRTPGPSRTARAFTMLELVLAMVLGVMVIAGAMSLFRVLDRSQVRQQSRMEENMQIARAHKVTGLVFQTLLMAPSDVSERDVETRLEEDDSRNSEDRLELQDEDSEDARLALQPDAALGVRMVVATDRGERLTPAQTFAVTLRQSPLASGGDKTEEEQADADFERMLILESALAKTGAGSNALEELRQSDSAREREPGSRSSMDSDRTGEGRESGRSSSSSSSSSSRRSGSLGEAESLVDRALGRSGGSSRSSGTSESDDLTASERLEARQQSRPRAPGVRGVFEILPDDAEPGSERAAAPSEFAVTADGPTYSLWWRELPPRLADEDLSAEGVDLDGDSASGDDNNRDRNSRAERERDRRARADAELVSLAGQSEFSGKRERLLSGCKSIHWTALRGKKPRDKLTALYDRELPGYIELEFETASGRKEKWMFEVAWMVGPEPGSILPDQPDALNNIAAVGDPTDPNDPNYRAPTKPDDPSQQNNPDNPNVTDPNNPNNPNSPLRPKPPTAPNKPGELNNNPSIKPVTKPK